MCPTNKCQSGPCAYCRKDTTNVCTGCNWSLESLELEFTKTYYCNGACQQEDWVSHKAACKATQERKWLYRAGSTIQTVFYKYREKVFDKPIVKVERKGDTMYLHEGDCKSLVIPFPSHLFQDEQERKAALVSLACDDSVGCTHGITKMMLKGLCSKATEVSLQLKNKRRWLKSVDMFGVERNVACGHLIIQVTLKSGECYALDFSSAQYGYYAPVIPWDSYVESRVGSFLNFWDFGDRQSRFLSDRGDNVVSAYEDLRKLNKSCIVMLNVALVDWQKKNLPLSAMLKLPEAGFEQKQSDLIRFIEWYMPTNKEMEKWYKRLAGDKEEPEASSVLDESLSMT